MKAIAEEIFEARRILERSKIISALANCHIHGLYSIVLRERVDEYKGMLRIFYVPESCRSLERLMTGNDYSLMPHNHRQDITLYGLFGHATNVMHKYVPKEENGMPKYEYSFGSALIDGEFSLNLEKEVNQAGAKWDEIDTNGVCLLASDIHTVVAEPGSAWLVVEGKLSERESTRCYSMLANKKLSSEGLYESIPSSALSTWAGALLGLWK